MTLLSMLLPVGLAAATVCDVPGQGAHEVDAVPQDAAPGGLPRGQLIQVAATPERPFRTPYLLYIPENLREGDLALCVTFATPSSTEPIENALATATEAAVRLAQPFSESERHATQRLGVPMAMPILPRLRMGNTNIYTTALTRAALMYDEEPMIRRVDLQILEMIDDARRRVAKSTGRTVHERVIAHGFSAAGHLVTRMAVLHPERFLAVWAGGVNGYPILPVTHLAGHELPYHVGIADVEDVVGRPFNREAFLRVQMMIVHGTEDQNSALTYRDSYTEEQERLVRLLGETNNERFDSMMRVYRDAGVNARFKKYEGVGHEVTQEMVDDLVDFFESALKGRR